MANERSEPELQLAAGEIEELAEKTDGFSFAYLKELGLSGMMAWMRTSKPGGMADAMLTQVEALRAQMKTEPPKAVPEVEDED